MPANMALCDNKMAIISWSDKPIGVLITSKQIVDKQKDFFKSLWKIIE